MPASSSNLVVVITVLICCCLLRASDVQATDMSEAFALFEKPRREYATAPLWVWNDMLTEEQVVGTMRDLAAQKVMQVFVHPRPGLMTPYLSNEWFQLWRAALAEAEKLDMNVWIYDENSYPSGFAGGFVPEAMPESRGRGLEMKESVAPPSWGADTVAVYRLDGEKYENVSRQIQANETLSPGKYVACQVRRAPDQAWTGNRCYVDLLYPGVVEKFLDVTAERYRREIGQHFGKRVPGIFTDEPHLQPAGGLPWTERLPEAFEKRWGYSLLDHLICLSKPLGDYKLVRHNYLQLLHELFVECWGKPSFEFCRRNNIEFTGHYWEHEWPYCLRVPDSMAMYAWHQRPAIDVLMNQYNQDSPQAQFGNVRIVKELAGVANQLGRRRTLCEAYGAGGWDLRFEDMKRIGDWLYVLGVNTLDEHLSYISIRGARKHDHPQSFSYHEPWWDAYHVSAGYFARLSAAMSQGEQINTIALLEPTTTAWMYNCGPDGVAMMGELGNSFQKLVTTLALAQVDYDILCEDILARHGAAEGKGLVVGRRKYEVLVLPPMTENLNAATVKLLGDYLKSGGQVLSCGEPPARVEGKESLRVAEMARSGNWKQVTADELPRLLPGMSKDGFAVRQAAGDRGILFHHRRQLNGGELVFLVNTSLDSSCSAKVESACASAEKWDIEQGKVEQVAYEQTDKGIRIPVELAPGGSLLLALHKDRRIGPAPPHGSASRDEVRPGGEVKIRRVDPNVLTIDYVDVTTNNRTRENINVLKAANFVFAENGLKKNPWDRAVQFEDELIRHRFSSSSGLEAAYRFVIREKVPESLCIVIERADLYKITCNGKEVKAAEGQWWLDKAFGKIDIAATAQMGENRVVIKASPLTMFHELAAAYVLGDFNLEPAEKGFVIVPAKDLKLGPWNTQGLPLYSHSVAYTRSFDVGSKNGRYYVSLPAWLGSVAAVKVNGQLAGYVWHQPWELDVTDVLKQYGNDIEVVVIGTLKNTLGPHHGNPGLGSAWPGMWDNAPEQGPPPGAEYSTVGYGLFEPFVLKRGS
ncbi:MAG TPA: glycosyl hydrolase [Phycisphaerae bacterium]|nr:glycosyl hydrolase [Phycisphaerae bacterium]HRR86250.1 glycosyl hydrolase [Phycisphaerae bacterium]